MVTFNKLRSIMVVATYRSGSTALCDYIAKQTGLLNCDEVFHPADAVCLYERVKDQRMVFKIMPDHKFEKYWTELVDTCYVVGLSRKNIVEQIASLCLASQRRTWHYVKENTLQPNILNNPTHTPFPVLSADVNYTADLDIENIENQCRYILDMYNKFNTLREHFDTDLVYEDIQTDLAASDYVPYPKPDNYQELISVITHALQRMNYVPSR